MNRLTCSSRGVVTQLLVCLTQTLCRPACRGATAIASFLKRRVLLWVKNLLLWFIEPLFRERKFELVPMLQLIQCIQVQYMPIKQDELENKFWLNPKFYFYGNTGKTKFHTWSKQQPSLWLPFVYIHEPCQKHFHQSVIDKNIFVN